MGTRVGHTERGAFSAVKRRLARIIHEARIRKWIVVQWTAC
jgi:hypothetical protein